ncbi:MAG: glycosyltransferase [Chloroflexi bacterium]|nr:glycosyltransferase [Chloroflexota bacterium]
MSPLSVGMISGEFPPMRGGMGDYTRELAKGLSNLGAKPWVLTSSRAKIEGIDLPFEVIPLIHRWDFSCLARIQNIVAQKKPEIVHLQYQAAAYGMRPAIHFLPWRLRRSHHRPKILVTFHDLRVPYLFPKAGPFRPWAMKFLARGCDAVVTTDLQDEETIKTWGMNKVVSLIPIGSNIPYQSPPGYSPEEWRHRLGINYGETLLTYFGFLNESKGGEELIRALEMLTRKGERVTLLIVGATEGGSDPTDQVYAQKVKRLISDLGLEAKVIWTGYEPSQKVSGHLLATDLCVLPYRDGASLRRGSLMAALAHGLAIVTTIPQTPNPQIVDGENMALVPEQDPKALAEKIETLAEDYRQRGHLADGARQLAQSFSWDKIAEQTLQVYRQLLDSK